ncbi:MAG: hypothetical protein A3G34_04895 [Candidatus Lindowbacteria bacterium RIFCSPLOWO2_12_FULL_62_27]|nr:MAG: hypothetical protein A3G34_04895 [Candidatus Lindowbacteria bacterium RIFCSPLOWO2_12_FULL_62_27]OGH62090.1 MAG: hypothetical protein A3I06_02440 [Candidatus Lindowbacteria bacterium RIFCSPLOWO2_02_FULL_62_12]
MGSHIVEKDFWVCWLLGVIFSDPELGGRLIFKGGTSLSKVFGIIQRFSEDIDLAVDPDWLGFGGDMRPDAASSRSQHDKRTKVLEEACITVVRDRFMPVLARHITAKLPGTQASALEFEVDAATHSPVILFAYPRSGKITGSLRPQVKLEFGALYDQRPVAAHTITPIVADVFSDLFRAASCPVVALEAERTFWEKATILHAEYHRPADKPPAIGISRHYYDMYCLSRNPAGERALADIDLLTRVRKHKQSFFRSAWAHYDTAMPGSFHLAPAPDRRQQIERDYRDMTDMFMSTPPPFAAMMTHLAAVEEKFNAGKIGQMRTDLDRPR